MNIRRICHLAGVGAIIDELDLPNYNGGITPHDITSPRDALLKDVIERRIWFLLVMKNLQIEK